MAIQTIKKLAESPECWQIHTLFPNLTEADDTRQGGVNSELIAPKTVYVTETSSTT